MFSWTKIFFWNFEFIWIRRFTLFKIISKIFIGEREIFGKNKHGETLLIFIFVYYNIILVGTCDHFTSIQLTHTTRKHKYTINYNIIRIVDSHTVLGGGRGVPSTQTTEKTGRFIYTWLRGASQLKIIRSRLYNCLWEAADIPSWKHKTIKLGSVFTALTVVHTKRRLVDLKTFLQLILYNNNIILPPHY